MIVLCNATSKCKCFAFCCKTKKNHQKTKQYHHMSSPTPSSSSSSSSCALTTLLPEEILLHCFSYVHTHTLITTLTLVNKQHFYHTITNSSNDSVLWKARCEAYLKRYYPDVELASVMVLGTGSDNVINENQIQNNNQNIQNNNVNNIQGSSGSTGEEAVKAAKNDGNSCIHDKARPYYDMYKHSFVFTFDATNSCPQFDYFKLPPQEALEQVEQEKQASNSNSKKKSNVTSSRITSYKFPSTSSEEEQGEENTSKDYVKPLIEVCYNGQQKHDMKMQQEQQRIVRQYIADFQNYGNNNNYDEAYEDWRKKKNKKRIEAKQKQLPQVENVPKAEQEQQQQKQEQLAETTATATTLATSASEYPAEAVATTLPTTSTIPRMLTNCFVAQVSMSKNSQDTGSWGNVEMHPVMREKRVYFVTIKIHIPSLLSNSWKATFGVCRPGAVNGREEFSSSSKSMCEVKHSYGLITNELTKASHQRNGEAYVQASTTLSKELIEKLKADLKPGDIIGMMVDMRQCKGKHSNNNAMGDKGFAKLSFYKNGHNLGVAFAHITECELQAAISVVNKTAISVCNW